MAFIVVLMFVASGFAALTYEVVWTKQLSLIFGVNHQAVSAVLAAYMAGLALGSLILGRLADRSSRPLRFYGLLELGVGLSALLMWPLFQAINAAYVATARALPQGSGLFGLMRFALCFACVVIPTALMGGTLPAMTRFFVNRISALGRGAGLLYGANTLGAVLGAALAGFVLLGLLGMRGTTYVGVALNLGVGALAVGIGSRAASLAERGDEPARPAAVPTGPALAALIGFGVAGFASLSYEVLWTRVLVYFLGLNIYAFSAILATFLLGLTIGSFTFARVADRRNDLLAVFGLMEIAIGISAVFCLQFMGVLMALAEATVLGRLLAAGALILIPTILMGGAFPVVARLYARSMNALATDLANLYAANTIGCVGGSLFAGFILLAAFGAQGGILATAALSVLLGMAMVALEPQRGLMRSLGMGLAIPVLAAGMIMARGLAPTVVYCGSFRAQPGVRLACHREGKEARWSWQDAAGNDVMRLLYYREGSEASLAVLEVPPRLGELNVNGWSTAYATAGDITVHKMLGHLPVMLADKPKSALIIGFGLGSTAWSMARHALLRIDCAELVPDETRTARYFREENGDVLLDPRFRLIIADGRNYLLTTRRRYDVISTNAIHPSISPFLYTREFYLLCKSRLSPSGVMCVWLPTNTRHMRGLARTFLDVFPHSSLWFCNPGHTVMIGSRRPLRISYARFSAEARTYSVARSLAQVGLNEPTTLLSTMLLDERGLRSWTRGAALNTDNLPQAEFEASPGPPLEGNVWAILRYRANAANLVSFDTPPAESAAARRRLDLLYSAGRHLVDAWTLLHKGYPDWAAREAEQALRVCPDDMGAKRLLTRAWMDMTLRQPELLRDKAFRDRMIALGLEAVGKPGQAPEKFVVPFRLGLARALIAARRIREARQQLAAVARLDPSFGAVRAQLRQLDEMPLAR